MVNQKKRFTVRELAQEFWGSKRTILRGLQEETYFISRLFEIFIVINIKCNITTIWTNRRFWFSRHFVEQSFTLFKDS